MAEEVLKVDLQDDIKLDNLRFYALLDRGFWEELKSRVEEGENLEVVFEEMMGR